MNGNAEKLTDKKAMSKDEYISQIKNENSTIDRPSIRKEWVSGLFAEPENYC